MSKIQVILLTILRTCHELSSTDLSFFATGSDPRHHPAWSLARAVHRHQFALRGSILPVVHASTLRWSVADVKFIFARSGNSLPPLRRFQRRWCLLWRSFLLVSCLCGDCSVVYASDITSVAARRAHAPPHPQLPDQAAGKPPFSVAALPLQEARPTFLDARLTFWGRRTPAVCMS